MLTLKQIYDDKARVIAGLEKKHFVGAAEAIEEVLRLDAERKAAQQQKDAAAADMALPVYFAVFALSETDDAALLILNVPAAVPEYSPLPVIFTVAFPALMLLL